MTKTNRTALSLTVLLTAGLFSLAGAIAWFGLKNPPSGHLPSVERDYNFDVSWDGALKRCKL